MTEKERSLIAGCMKGEKAAWDAFVLQYSALIYHTIRKTFTSYHAEPPTDEVEDLYQEFFISVLRDDCKKLGQFRGDQGCSLASWIRVVAARLTIDSLRKREAPSVEVPESLALDQPDASDRLIEHEEEKLLLETLNNLSARDKLFVDLYFRQALPPEDIAVMLKVSVSAVYTQKSRLVGKLSEILSKGQAM